MANLSVLSDYAYLRTRDRYDGSNEGGFAVASKAVLQQPCQLRISIRNILHPLGYACFLSAPSTSSFTTCRYELLIIWHTSKAEDEWPYSSKTLAT